ncbi:MAG: hypothetical protein ACLSHO_13065 [Dysosmobacter sp.]
MKRLFAAILCLCLLAGCGRTDSTGNTCRAEDEPTVGAEKAEPIGESFRIIQEKPDWLLLAKEEGGSAECVYPLPARCRADTGRRSLRTERAGGLSALS